MSATKRSLGLHGASGRMGIRLVQLISQDPEASLAFAADRPGHAQLGEDAGSLAGLPPVGVRLGTLADEPPRLDAMIDFSQPAASLAAAEFCAGRGLPLVVGTTGFEPDQRARLEGFGARIPILISPNMSRAVNLLMKLVEEAARALGPDVDIEIVERHHRHKKDSPSGTALRLAEFAARGAGISRLVHGREGLVGERPRDEIGIHAVRAGDAPGDHTVIFGLMGESLELSHRALNRDGFVRGAIDAAKFLAGKPARVYTMAEVLA
ncbi:4-hydroxy-tetrahydrodipicolinate reductase [Aquisphaera giovannonii]|uniref:4-hydroxy-tetrahydrodipicolinate reductase n=1 Tax=Aquisphaera giovannonii TaxID=406548 RepID=A0A5B9W238_9BACT|nr:4-hydroxy-tetrahydrodipicolinate reductase [Aquisphaera giovannonii]QEH34050.1 4-hydroxy-tetrahydrodipicolinate reductase [Aquisphaera giovannonii]